MKPEIVLASASPRRRELLARICDKFEIISAEVDESLPLAMHPREGVVELARRKGRAVSAGLSPEKLVVSADTLVELDGVALGKPRDEGEAGEMLRALSGRWHNVHTGVAVEYRGRVFSGSDTSRVEFLPLSDEDIESYVRSGEPMDKAGSYAIQGLGGALVRGYEGSFDNIVGLPLELLSRLISEALGEFDEEK